MNNGTYNQNNITKITAIVAVITSVILTSLGMNFVAYGTIDDTFGINIDDIGQSAECVIVVIGCDGTGSVGSSGDTIIGSNNGNDDNNTVPNPNGGGNQPGILPDLTVNVLGRSPPPEAGDRYNVALEITSANADVSSPFQIQVSDNVGNSNTGEVSSIRAGTVLSLTISVDYRSPSDCFVGDCSVTAIVDSTNAIEETEIHT
jgi:hypothetical protein